MQAWISRGEEKRSEAHRQGVGNQKCLFVFGVCFIWNTAEIWLFIYDQDVEVLPKRAWPRKM